MMRGFRVWLWGIVAELEYQLYPWINESPPNWAVERYNLDHGIKDGFEDHMYYDWLLSQEQKIQKIEQNIIFIAKELEELKK
tara:strand:- start:504 stop:749 length:246 start_codon:yes stop_codon:yes gene_type:complete